MGNSCCSGKTDEHNEVVNQPVNMNHNESRMEGTEFDDSVHVKSPSPVNQHESLASESKHEESH